MTSILHIELLVFGAIVLAHMQGCSSD